MKYMRGAAGNDLIFFILFIILIGVMWVSTGGPDRAISRSGPFLGGSPFSEEGATGIPTVQDRAGGSSNGSVITEINNTFASLKEGEERSPYSEYVSLSISTAKEKNPDDEYITLKTSRTLNGTLTISDWRIESSNGTTVTLGNASPLPSSGQVNTQLPIAISANTTVYITSGRSPIGTSFRVNKCTGYFEQFQDFIPRLPQECPFPSEELGKVSSQNATFEPTPACYGYVSTLTQCSFTDASIESGIEPACRAFVSNDLSYNGCVNLHSTDAGFFKSEWRVFLNQNEELWGTADERIRLLDENGFVIDVISY